MSIESGNSDESASGIVGIAPAAHKPSFASTAHQSTLDDNPLALVMASEDEDGLRQFLESILPIQNARGWWLRAKGCPCLEAFLSIANSRSLDHSQSTISAIRTERFRNRVATIVNQLLPSSSRVWRAILGCAHERGWRRWGGLACVPSKQTNGINFCERSNTPRSNQPHMEFKMRGADFCCQPMKLRWELNASVHTPT